MQGRGAAGTRCTRPGTPSPSSREAEGGGWGPAPLPLLFSSTSSRPRHPPGTSRRGRGLHARGEKDRSLQPRPAMRGSPSLSPEGEGAASARRAPPHSRRRRKPPGAPLLSPHGSGPCWRPPPGHKAPRQGGGAYRDVRDALLPLMRHGPPGALYLASGPAGCLTPYPALSRRHYSWEQRQRPRRDGRKDRSSTTTAAHSPLLGPPPLRRLPAPPGLARRAGGGGRGRARGGR